MKIKLLTITIVIILSQKIVGQTERLLQDMTAEQKVAKSVNNSVDSTNLRIMFIDNEGLFIQSRKHKVLIDALFSWYFDSPAYVKERMINGAQPFDNLDIIFVTHEHSDHFSADEVVKCLRNNPQTKLVTSNEVIPFLEQSSYYHSIKDQIVDITPKTPGYRDTTIADISIRAYGVSHGCSYSVTMDGHNFFHSGDMMWLDTVKNDYLDADIAFIAYWTLILEKIAWLKPEHVIPIHLYPRDLETIDDRIKELELTFPNADYFRNPLEVKELQGDQLINIINHPPEIINKPQSVTVPVDSLFELDISDIFRDEDKDDTLLIECHVPQWLIFNKENMKLSGIPKSVNPFNFVTIYATDRFLARASVNFTINVEDMTSIEASFHNANKFSLAQNYPNPFNPSTTIKYDLQKPSNVTLKIYNLSGQELGTLVNGFQTAGVHEITWQPKGLPSGIYFYNLQTGDPSSSSLRQNTGQAGQRFSETKKLLLQK